jgi:glycerol-3-phosphate O-acyltransferase / dihydroxyacetone phosphate acyltransferase
VFYRLFRFATSLAFRLFFRIEPPVDTLNQLAREGSVIFIGNHPNGLIDPGILFILVKRQVTFLAKAPLFSIPVVGHIIRGLGALPVYRKQDNPSDMSKNDGSLDAAVKALVSNGAITLFPEGKSHSEPQLSELKTGAARIALEAAKQGAHVAIVPIGMTYEAKHLFRSKVHIEVGKPIDANAFLPRAGGESFEVAKLLTETMSEALSKVTLNLEAWDDHPLVETAEQLFALQSGEKSGDPERIKAFARALPLLRDEKPDLFNSLKIRLENLKVRLEQAGVTVTAVSGDYTAQNVATFIAKNVLWLALFPVFVIGMAVFVVPYFLPLLAVKLAKPGDDTESTIKVLTAMLVGPLWLTLLTVIGWVSFGAVGALAALVCTAPLAIFTRRYFERIGQAFIDARAFFLLKKRIGLKQKLEADAQQIAFEITALAESLKGRV